MALFGRALVRLRLQSLLELEVLGAGRLLAGLGLLGHLLAQVAEARSDIHGTLVSGADESDRLEDHFFAVYLLELIVQGSLV